MTPKSKAIPLSFTKSSEWMVRGLPVNESVGRVLAYATEEAIGRCKTEMDTGCLLEGMVRIQTPNIEPDLGNLARAAKSDLDKLRRSEVIRSESVEGMTKLIKAILGQ